MTLPRLPDEHKITGTDTLIRQTSGMAGETTSVDMNLCNYQQSVIMRSESKWDLRVDLRENPF